MSWGQLGFVANDNDPMRTAVSGDRVGFRAELREKQKDFARLQHTGPVIETDDLPKARPVLILLSATLWIGSLMAVIVSMTNSFPVQVSVLAAIALIWTGLWFNYISQDRQKFRIADLAMLSVFGGFFALVHISISRLGIPLDTNQVVAIIAITGLVISFMSKSVVGLVVSIGASIVWAGLFFDGQLLVSKLWYLIPLLLCAQLIAGVLIRSPIATLTANAAIYFWAGGFLLMEFEAGRISLLYISSLASIAGTLHQIASARQMENPYPTTSLHQAFGFLLAMSGIIGIAHFWIFAEHDLWQSAFKISPTNFALWTVMSITGAGLAFILSFRNPSSQLLSAVSAILIAAPAVAIWKYDDVLNALYAQWNIDAHPLLGFALVGIIFVSAFCFALMNYRRRNFVLTLTGLAAIGICSHLIFGEADTITTPDLQALFASGLCTLCLIAWMRIPKAETPSTYRRSLSHA